MNKKVLKEFLKAGFVEDFELFPTEKGTPQGGPLSPIIANITLNGIEKALGEKFYSRKNGTIDKPNKNRHKVNYVRFADDFVVTTDSEEIAYEIINLIEEFLEPRGLKLSTEKTYVTHISDGFTFLGWTFRKFKGKLLIKPSKESQKSVITKIRDVIQRGKAWDQDRLIRMLNPIIKFTFRTLPTNERTIFLAGNMHLNLSCTILYKSTTKHICDTFQKQCSQIPCLIFFRIFRILTTGK